MLKKKADGEWMHQAPFGYRTVKDSAGRIVLELDPKTFRYILEAWKLKEAGFTLKEIADHLNRKGVRTKRGRKLTPTSALRILERLS